MKVTKSNDIYKAVDVLIVQLRTEGAASLADALHHRMHSVSWTTQSELLEELQSVLSTELDSGMATISGTLQRHVREVLTIINLALDPR